MKSSTCLIHVLVFIAFATNVWANTAPLSSVEITDEGSYPFLVPGPKRSRFLTGSRYGRSQGGGGGSDESQTVNVAPRNNRFFTGSRYGKRADEPMSYVYQADAAAAGARDIIPTTTTATRFESGSPLNCVYASAMDFVRCVQRFRAAALLLQNVVANDNESARP